MTADTTAAIGLDELVVDAPTRVEVDGTPVCLVRRGDGTVAAIHDTCSHQEASLAEGMLWGDEVECPLHGTAFDLATGAPTSLPATQPVPTFAVQIVDGAVVVDVTRATNGAPTPDH